MQVLPVTLNAPIPGGHDVVCHLQPRSIAVRPCTATLIAPSQDNLGSFLYILWEMVSVKKWRVGDEGQNLLDEGDRLVLRYLL